MSTVPSVDLVLDVAPRVSLALQQQGVPFVRRIRLSNLGTEALEDLVVHVRADPPFLVPVTWRLDGLAPGGQHDVDLGSVQLSPSFLAAQAERENGFLEVEVRQDGDVIGTRRNEVEVLAPTQWTGVGVLPELLAAFVRPNARVLVPLLQSASARLEAAEGDGALCGYQKRDPRHAAALVQALWEAVQAAQLGYINPPASFEQGGQKVRTHEQVLGDRLGTCLDLTVLLAALFEQAGLHAVVVIVQGHAFVGAWLTDFELPEALLDDPLPLRKRVALGEALIVDSSPVTSSGTFARAVAAAESMLARDDTFVLALDVAAARHAAAPVRPLPLDRSGDELAHAVSVVVGSTPGSGEALPAERFRTAPTPAAPKVATRLDRWQQRLLDLSLRNRAVNHKEGARTLPIPHLDVGGLEDALASGEVVALQPRMAGAGVASELPAETREAQRADHARTLQRAGRLAIDLAPAELAKHALELYRLSRSAQEETGAGVLYLALGFLKWFEAPSSQQARYAPLVLVPVELVRPKGDGAAWALRGLDEETRVNVTLVEKLRRDFGLDVQGVDTPPTDAAGVDVPAVLHAFRRATLQQTRWEVVEQASVATFSFAKFLMWLDLGAKREQLLANPVVRLLSEGQGGGDGLGPPLTDAALAARPGTEVLTVVDADPSQLRAIAAAEEGRSFVLQGPPGTGKSQTITNLIAQLLATGKSVLFVSEKMAALEVVQARLEKAGLGPFCLELHSQQATRAAVVRQLAAPFEIARERATDAWARHHADLLATRQVLDRHAQRLAAPTPFGVPLRTVVAELVGLADAPWVRLPTVQLPNLEDVRSREAATERVVLALGEAEPVAAHPFRGVGVSTWTPSWQEQVEGALAAADVALGAVQSTRGPALAALGLPELGDGLDEADALATLAHAALTSRGLPEALYEPVGFSARTVEIEGWITRGRALRARSTSLLTAWQPALLGLDLDTLRTRFQRWAGSFFLLAFFALWGARRALSRVVVGALPDHAGVSLALDEAAWTRDEAAVLGALAEGPRWLGPLWRGADTDWDSVADALEGAKRAQAARLRVAGVLGTLGPLAQATSLLAEGGVLLQPGTPREVALRGVVDAVASTRAALSSVHSVLQLAEAGVDSTVRGRRAAVQQMAAARGRLRTWCSAVGAIQAATALGLWPLVDAVLAGTLPREGLRRALDRSLREGWWRAHLDADPELAAFSGVRHADVVARFRTLDARSLELARSVLVDRLVQRLPDLHGPGEELALLRRQLQLQKRHLPPRKLFATLPNVLKRIKPVVLMSPQSVARFLDPSLEGYDVVVFDEASQIPPWDAIGAIARGRQAIIVGDSKQLPPTSFFDRADDDDDLPDEESVQELESILDEATASNLLELRLRWHYRSRHESLIAFSNHHYYANSLLTFPSAQAWAKGVGVELRPLPPGSYDRGGARTNRPEAEAVVAELERLLDLPDDQRPSVGVVTFSMAQQRLVEDLCDALRLRRPELDAAFTEGEREHVFVKNLENVQGDERDVMLFSIGYGADRSGKLTMSFGPVNRKGGERRLNVAITRARSRLIVFSTLDPDQIDLNRTSAVGARHLKAFLRYARDGVRAIDAEALAEGALRFESPFEEQVHSALTAAGLTVHSQVGCSGYRVDLAVVDPERPGTYLLGVECDGAAYHGSRSARERDRLRQAVLEQLGWTMHRIWSTDWWFDPSAQTARVLEAVEAARRAPRRTEARPAQATAPAPRIASRTVEAQLAAPPTAALPSDASPWRALVPVIGADKETFYYPVSRRQLSTQIAEVVQAAGPVHRLTAWRHIASGWGFRQLGSRIQEQLDLACAEAAGPLRPVIRGDFLWPSQLQPSTWRAFRPSDDGARGPDEVPPEELANAAAWVLSRGLAMAEDELITETARVFGWYRTGKGVAACVAEGVGLLVKDGRGVLRGGKVVLA